MVVWNKAVDEVDGISVDDCMSIVGDVVLVVVVPIFGVEDVSVDNLAVGIVIGLSVVDDDILVDGGVMTVVVSAAVVGADILVICFVDKMEEIVGGVVALGNVDVSVDPVVLCVLDWGFDVDDIVDVGATDDNFVISIVVASFRGVVSVDVVVIGSVVTVTLSTVSEEMNSN